MRLDDELLVRFELEADALGKLVRVVVLLAGVDLAPVPLPALRALERSVLDGVGNDVDNHVVAGLLVAEAIRELRRSVRAFDRRATRDVAARRNREPLALDRDGVLRFARIGTAGARIRARRSVRLPGT